MGKKQGKSEMSSMRPPIVAVLGHVDHGKTSLLDTIRKTQVAQSEHGGITQHIGAYQIPGITFIDTPGHEAFAKMRTRGASASDIAVLVVAADDGVMPQTKESIRMIQEAHVSMIVAINKIDLSSINVDKVKQDLARNGVQLEGFGGDIPFALVSAKTGKGISDLLELIKLLADTKSLVSEPEKSMEAVVIETRVDKGKGMVATVIIKQGTLKSQMALFDKDVLVGKVRAMFDEFGKRVVSAPPSKPVEVLGFTQLPSIGSMITETLIKQESITSNIPLTSEQSIQDFLSKMGQSKKLPIIIKSDTSGSLEAILEAIGKDVDVVSKGIGDIADQDILLAKSTNAFVIGFNVKCKAEIEKLAQIEGVITRTYKIIYELLDELHDVIEAGAEVISQERELGKGMVIAEFPFDGKRIAGTKVVSGRLAKGDQIKILRKDKDVGRVKIKSVRKGKNEETKVEIGNECGILFDHDVAFEIGDDIIAFTNR